MHFARGGRHRSVEVTCTLVITILWYAFALSPADDYHYSHFWRISLANVHQTIYWVQCANSSHHLWFHKIQGCYTLDRSWFYCRMWIWSVGEASLLPSESAVNTHISPEHRRSLQGKVTSAVSLEIHSSSISFPLICSSYLKSPSTWYLILPWNSASLPRKPSQHDKNSFQELIISVILCVEFS